MKSIWNIWATDFYQSLILCSMFEIKATVQRSVLYWVGFQVLLHLARSHEWESGLRLVYIYCFAQYLYLFNVYSLFSFDLSISITLLKVKHLDWTHFRPSAILRWDAWGCRRLVQVTQQQTGSGLTGVRSGDPLGQRGAAEGRNPPFPAAAAASGWSCSDKRACRVGG